jgi:hypothetical protein
VLGNSFPSNHRPQFEQVTIAPAAQICATVNVLQRSKVPSGTDASGFLALERVNPIRSIHDWTEMLNRKWTTAIGGRERREHQLTSCKHEHHTKLF